MTGAAFHWSDLKGVNIGNAELSGANFVNANIDDIPWDSDWNNTRWTDWEYYDFEPITLSCELVPYAYCAGADLSHMDLSGMDLTGINLRGRICKILPWILQP